MEKIDLSELHNNTVEKIKIENSYIIDKSYYKDTEVKKINKVKVVGTIARIDDEDDYLDLEVTGSMELADSISLKEVNYPFSFKIEGNMTEILGNCPNKLDILELLWENIVLEVPLKFTEESDLSKFHGDGWRLLSEEEHKKENNPFNDLLKEIGKE